MKLNVFGREFTFLEAKGLEAEADRGLGWRKPRTHYKPDKIGNYYKAYLDHDLVRQIVDDLAESAVGQGLYTAVPEPPSEQGVFSVEEYGAEEKELVDDFNQELNMDSLLPNICRNMLIAGFVPVSTVLNKLPEKCSAKILHPKTVVDIDAENSIINEIVQKVADEKATLKGEDLAWFVYCQIANDVRGTSLVRGLLHALNTLEDVTSDVADILDRYISPIGIWKTKDKADTVKAAVTERNPGEDIFLGQLSNQEMEQDICQFIQVDPRVPFWEYIENLQKRIYSYSRASNLIYIRNATQASAKMMEKVVARHVEAIRRDVKRAVERFWYAPLIEEAGLKVVPKLMFGEPVTGVEDLDVSGFLQTGLEIGYISPEQFRDILKQTGIKVKDVDVGGAKPKEHPSEES